MTLEDLEQQARDETNRLRNSVENLRNILNNLVIIDQEDFKFHELCNDMYKKRNQRLASTWTNQSSIEDFFEIALTL
jgi:hypothetical protein